MSRRDEIWQDPERVIAIAGGKLTGYRKMAEQVLDRVSRVLKRKTRLADPFPDGPFGAHLGYRTRLAGRLLTRQSDRGGQVRCWSPKHLVR